GAHADVQRCPGPESVRADRGAESEDRHGTQNATSNPPSGSEVWPEPDATASKCGRGSELAGGASSCGRPAVSTRHPLEAVQCVACAPRGRLPNGHGTPSAQGFAQVSEEGVSRDGKQPRLPVASDVMILSSYADPCSAHWL